jgi:cytochrome b6-f complex iron-sulfur subunit
MSSSEDPTSVGRRRFLNLTVGGSAAAVVVIGGYPVVKYLEPSAQQGTSGPTRVGAVTEFPPDSAQVVLAGEHPVVIVHKADRIRAFSARCTHLQCIVAYSAEHQQIECQCHGGSFALDGRVLGGPPVRPLTELSVSIEEGFLLVSVPG